MLSCAQVHSFISGLFWDGFNTIEICAYHRSRLRFQRWYFLAREQKPWRNVQFSGRDILYIGKFTVGLSAWSHPINRQFKNSESWILQFVAFKLKLQKWTSILVLQTIFRRQNPFSNRRTLIVWSSHLMYRIHRVRICSWSIT